MPTVQGNGIDIYYEVQGEGEPLVLIPYLAIDQACYAFQVAEYAKHFTCFTVDLRGAGLSGKPEGTYTTELFADDIAAFMHAANVERAHVAGLSLGAATGMWLAAKHPDRVKSLSLHSAWHRSDPFLRTVVESWRVMAEGLGSLGLITGFLTRVAAFGIAVNMAVAVYMLHFQHGFFMNRSGAQKASSMLPLETVCTRLLKMELSQINVRHSIDSSRRSDWPRASQGGRPRSRACILLWRSRLPIDATLRPIRCFHFGGRVSSPHRAQHVGKSRRLSATARQHGTLPLGDSLSDAR